MIRVIVAGISAHSRLLRRQVESYYNHYAQASGTEELLVVGFFDIASEANAIDTIDDIMVFDRNSLPLILNGGDIGAILLPEQPTLDIQFLMHWFRSIGVYQDSIYFASREIIEKKSLSNADIENLLVPYAEVSYLPYIEFHIEDSCNMNCKACEHYSPLVRKSDESGMNYDEVERDFWQLKKLIDRIGRIRILGGEPLLNPELSRYLRLVRDVYPEADIFVVTNALLLDRLDDEVYEVMRATGALFMVSYYPPLEGKLEKKIQTVNSRGIDVMQTPLITEFSMKQNLHGGNDPREEFARCFQSACNNLYKGKIAACMLPFMTHYFNETFDKNLPLDGAIDLYEEGLTTYELKRRLEIPFSRCAYCGEPVNVPWQQAHKEPDISDFVIR